MEQHFRENSSTGCAKRMRQGIRMKSLNKALDILELIADNGATGVRELAQMAGLPPSTTHRIVASLVGRGYLTADDRTRRYMLSPKLLILGDKAKQQIDIVSIARPFLEQLMEETRENTNLCVRNGHHVIYVDHVRSPDHNLRIFTKLGGSAPLYASGVGKVFLSFFSSAELDAYLDDVRLEPFTPATLTTIEAMKDEMKQIREAGFAVDNQEKEMGVRCVAAPVLDHGGRIRAAISVSGPVQRIAMKRLPALSRLVVEIAGRISISLGYDQDTTVSRGP